MHIMVDGTFVSNCNVYDIDTMWNENRERLLHTCDEVDVCWTLCEYNHVVYIILYLLVVCNRDDKQKNWIASVFTLLAFSNCETKENRSGKEVYCRW